VHEADHLYCSQTSTRWFKYDRDYLCVNKSQFVPVIFEPPCTCGTRYPTLPILMRFINEMELPEVPCWAHEQKTLSLGDVHSGKALCEKTLTFEVRYQKNCYLKLRTEHQPTFETCSSRIQVRGRIRVVNTAHEFDSDVFQFGVYREETSRLHCM
jgi:hypothetical protein